MSNSQKFDLATASRVEIREYLASREIFVAPHAQIRPLTGGVSGAVIRITDEAQDLIIKQAFAELAVPDEWRADPGRAITEARGLELFSRMAPEHAPQVIYVDSKECIIVMQAAPSTWQAWKETLLQNGATDEDLLVGAELGKSLSAWHENTSRPAIFEQFADDENFRALRSKPFYLDVADKHPHIRQQIAWLASTLHGEPICVVHGDFSPKNILVGPKGQFWVLDFETAVASQPVFDVAFMVMHLTLKALVSGQNRALEVARSFLKSYFEHAAPTIPLDESLLIRHVAVLCLARVDGVSKVDYLTSATTDFVRVLAISFLTRETPTIDELWQEVQMRKKAQS